MGSLLCSYPGSRGFSREMSAFNVRGFFHAVVFAVLALGITAIWARWWYGQQK